MKVLIFNTHFEKENHVSRSCHDFDEKHVRGFFMWSKIKIVSFTGSFVTYTFTIITKHGYLEHYENIIIDQVQHKVWSFIMSYFTHLWHMIAIVKSNK